MEKINEAERQRNQRQQLTRKDINNGIATREDQKSLPTNGNYYGLVAKGNPARLPSLRESTPVYHAPKPSYEYVRPSWWG